MSRFAIGLLGVLLAVPALAIERAEAMLYVLQPVDVGGVTVSMIVPEPNKTVSEAGAASRPMKAFEALRARSPKAYGSTSLQPNSATKATLLLDKVADHDQVLAEVYWSLASLGFTELLAPPYVKDAVRLDDLSFAAQVPVLQVWDLLRFHREPAVVARAWLTVAGRLEPVGDAVARLQKGDAGLRKALLAAMTAPALRPKLAVLEAIADGPTREAFKLKADDAIAALGDSSLQVRGTALDAVIAAGFAKTAKVADALEQLVEADGDAELKLRAVKALAKAGVTKFNDLLESEKLRTGSAREALEAVDKLSKSPQVKIAAPALVGALSHSDGSVRDAAFKGLVGLKQWELLHQALGSDQLAAKMREDIARALVDNGSPAAKDQSLQSLLQKGSAGAAVLAAQAYGKIGAKTAAPLLIEALKHDSAEVRATAAEALATLLDERALVPLADAAEANVRDRDAMMKAAQAILASLRLDQVNSFASSKNLTIRQMAIRSLAEFAKGSRPRPDVVATLQEALKDADAKIKLAAVYALARLLDDGISRDLAALAKDSDPEVRQNVALSLGNATAKFAEADKQLEDMVKDTAKRVRIEAIGSLAKRKAASAVPLLSGLTKQPDPEVKRAVFAALVALRDDGNAGKMRPLFRDGMMTKDSKVRLTCIGALADKVTADDIEALRQASFDPARDVRAAAVAALAGSKLSEAMDALANFFADADMDVREKALDGVCAIPPGDNKRARDNYLKDFQDVVDAPDRLKKKAAGCVK
jgi:HEAT repeat protein